MRFRMFHRMFWHCMRHVFFFLDKHKKNKYQSNGKVQWALAIFRRWIAFNFQTSVKLKTRNWKRAIQTKSTCIWDQRTHISINAYFNAYARQTINSQRENFDQTIKLFVFLVILAVFRHLILTRTTNKHTYKQIHKHLALDTMMVRSSQTKTNILHLYILLIIILLSDIWHSARSSFVDL